MATYTVAHAAAHFEELAAQVEGGDEVVLTRDERQVLKLVAVEESESSPKRQFGRYKGMFTIAENFDDPVWADEEYYEAWLNKP